MHSDDANIRISALRPVTFRPVHSRRCAVSIAPWCPTRCAHRHRKLARRCVDQRQMLRILPRRHFRDDAEFADDYDGICAQFAVGRLRRVDAFAERIDRHCFALVVEVRRNFLPPSQNKLRAIQHRNLREDDQPMEASRRAFAARCRFRIRFALLRFADFLARITRRIVRGRNCGCSPRCGASNHESAHAASRPRHVPSASCA